ncbi:MAG: alpha/beta hydrolase [Alphaproteobacteria bacterium]|jgi:pimeloyl-ACP methyl ester carboxylesterase|nr:alpha/beta hydrolase [Alphaproteobacteria bacterium]MCB1551224.1 alpha/beta hydrolase [Alphaproteobacteria bacterium]MCB9985592.1 alpha/beta hydrolase [Micavibrio sp.]
METNPEKINNNEGIPLAYRFRQGSPICPTLVFLPGYRSDMMGSKALFLEEWAKTNNVSYLRLDYSGHGESGGVFEDGTIGQWTQDALTIIDQVTTGHLIVVGSSMGGWIGLLVATKRSDRVKAFMGISAAPDFTKWVWDHHMTENQRIICQKEGKIAEESPYSDEPDVMTYALFEDGKKHLLLEKPIPFDNPVILIQGKQDQEVPWALTQKIANLLKPDQTRIIYIEDGEHRLSRPSDLNIIQQEIEKLYVSL